MNVSRERFLVAIVISCCVSFSNSFALKSVNNLALKGEFKNKFSSLNKEIRPSSQLNEFPPFLKDNVLSKELRRFLRLSPFTIPVAILGTVMLFLYNNYSSTKEILNDLGISEKISSKLARNIKDNIVETTDYDCLVEEKLFVERPDLLHQILEILNRKNANGKYFILFGAKGVGKSTIVERAIHNRKGIIKMQITTAFCRNEVMLELAKITNTAKLKPTTADFVASLKLGTSKEGIFPTIVVEVERAGSIDQSVSIFSPGIQAVRGVAKELSKKCNFLIVLSEANLILEFGKDIDRENFIFIDELTTLEAEKYLAALGLELSQNEIKYVLDSIGSNPATLRSMQEWVQRGKAIHAFVEGRLANARQDLVAFPHKKILKALKDHPEGVSPEYFDNQCDRGVDLSCPKDVGKTMKESNAITYRPESDKYEMISHRHVVALRSYDLKK
mmetsp:Transcript_11767/g.11407  ORF Transcript_11767/g.11407 Transcript_11767/m.11407 type:complete len:446 (+) Transcript_11767:101-1438(+)